MISSSSIHSKGPPHHPFFRPISFLWFIIKKPGFLSMLIKNKMKVIYGKILELDRKLKKNSSRKAQKLDIYTETQ